MGIERDSVDVSDTSPDFQVSPYTGSRPNEYKNKEGIAFFNANSSSSNKASKEVDLDSKIKEMNSISYEDDVYLVSAEHHSSIIDPDDNLRK